jgi:hypothetical protein
MVHKTAPNGRCFASYGSRKLDRLLTQNFWADLTFLYESGLWQKFSMTSPEALYTKNVINELIFLPVTHTTYFDTRFDRYRFLKSGFSVGQILDRLVYRCLVSFLGHEMGETYQGIHTRSEYNFLSFLMPTQTHVSDTHSHGYGHFSTATCGVSGLLENQVIEWVEVLAQLWTGIRLELSTLVSKLG